MKKTALMDSDQENAPVTPDMDDSVQAGASKKGSRGGRRGSRLFDYGELRLLLLAMLAEQPSHGYELIKAIKERFGGYYSPSPGVIYPTLTWLYDRGYAVIDTEDGGRKRYSITSEGQAFLQANKAATDMLMARISRPDAGSPPEQIVRAMDKLKLALSLRMKRAPLEESVLDKIAAVIEEAAAQVEQLMNASPVSNAYAQHVAEVSTAHAERYLRRLCNHFQHRSPVTSDERSGQIRLSIGEIHLLATDNVLKLTLLAASDDQVLKLRDIIESHLRLTASREELQIDWQACEPAAASA